MDRVEEFINNFKNGFNEEETKKLFTEGRCYHFAVILKNIFRIGDVVYDMVDCHFMYQNQGDCYDINGKSDLHYPHKHIRSLKWIAVYEKELYDNLVKNCIELN